MLHFLLSREFHVPVPVSETHEILRPPPRSARLKTRLGCEVLESREVPAVFNWLGIYAGGYSNTANWYGGGGAGSQTPKDGDDLYFGTTPQGKTINCDVPLPYSFAGVHLVNGYSGTVTVPNGTSVGILEVGTGTLATGANLVVTKILSIVGSSITSSSTSGIIHVTGTSSGGAQAIVGSVSNLGTTLSIEGNGVQGAKLSLTGGNINTNSNSQIQVLNHSQSKNSSSIIFNGVFLVDNSTHDVQVNSPFTVKGLQIQGTDGVFNAYSNITLAGDNFNLLNGKVFVDDGLHIYLDTQRVLNVASGMLTTGNNTVTLHGILDQKGGELILGASPNVSTLHITGKAYFTAGRISFADVDPNSGFGLCDQIYCDDIISFGPYYVYKVVTENVPVGATFLPFSAKRGIVGFALVVEGYTATTISATDGSASIQITKN